jgi:uncharacterized linocin/CFP29 family protein
MPEAISAIAPGPAQIGVLGQGGGGGLFGGTAGRTLMQNGWRVESLRPAIDGPADPAHPLGLNVNSGRYGNGELRYNAAGDLVVANAVNPYATLLRDEWVQFDRVVQQVARERLVVTQLLLGRGLRFPLANALGTMTLDWQQMVGDLVDAEVTMSGLNEATKDQLGFTNVQMPIPIFHKEWFYNLRHLEAARRNGRNVETAHATEATRKVAELVEKVIFDGLTIAGSTIYGLRTHPARKTLAMGTSWNTETGANIVADVRAMMDLLALPPNNQEGPYILLVARAHSSNLQNDYKAESDDTILQRIQAIDGIEQVVFTTRLTAGAILIQLTSDVVEIIDGLAPTLVEWDSHAGFQHNFKIFAIQLPRVRANGDGQTGIAHMS